MRRYTLVGILVGIGLLSGCADELPTATSEELVPVAARTVEVRLPFDDVADDLQVLGGFGSVPDLGHGMVARDFEETLNARTLVRFSSFPTSVEVEDTAGVTRQDSDLTFVGGRVIARFDTTDIDADSLLATAGAPLLKAGALTAPWHPLSATWELAVDTVNDRRPWPEAGAGPIVELDTARWDPTASDSVVFRVDSATMASWTDTTDATRGLRLDLETPELRFRLRNVSLAAEVRPSVNPDTTVFEGAEQRRITFIYSPFPEPPPDGLRIGGVPAWRTVFRVTLPETLDGPPELCAALGCPVRLEPDMVNSASLVLRTRRSPPAFQPEDTLTMDVRPVLRPSLLPKSPLGESLGRSAGRSLAPEVFGPDGGEIVELPLTSFVRDLIRGETSSGGEIHRMIALLSTVEPLSIAVAGFDGPGSDSPPVLRLIVTQDEGVTLP